jgi:aspartate/methionine/tyrosine aminotransferase
VAYPFFLAKLLVRTGLARFLPSVRRWTDGGGAFVRYYSDRVLAAPHAELHTAAEFLELHGPDAIDLAQGAPSFDLTPSGTTKLPVDRRGWPSVWGMPELREAVAEKLRTDRDLSVSPADEVLITPGAAGAMSLVLDTFINPGDRVVLFDPTSPLYALGLRQRRARIRWLASWMDNGRTRFRLDHLARALHGAKLMVLTSPANPTGGIVAAEDLEQISWWAARRDVLILSDDVFERYQYEGDRASVAALPRASRRTLIVGSMSKGHALASARVGWLAGHRHLVRPCALTAALQIPFVPTVCQQIALTALRQKNDVFVPIRAEFESRRRYAFERLRALGLQPLWPAGGFFFWLPVGESGSSGHEFAERLRSVKRVLVSPGELYGPSGSNYVRLSYAADDGRLREGLGRLAEFVRERAGTPAPEARQAA